MVYELTNHLGNVMAVISDKKLFSNIVVPETGAAPLYYPEVLSQTDYYAFGQEIKERAYRINGGYRYGFNGKESDPEVSGAGNQYDYGFRIYNPRIGRFLSVDPLTKSYPELTPYQFASNTPIEAIDLDGLESESSKKEGFWKSFGKSALRGVGNAISYVANNPNHAGYGINPKKLKVEDFEPYKINWSQQLDPTWQIQNFSQNLVFGTTNFVGGIIEGDGERTAQAIPPLLSSAGTVAGLRSLTVTKGMSLVAKMEARANFAKSFYKSAGGNARDVGGINLSKQVSSVALNSNTKLYQWTIDGKIGDYFSLIKDEKNLGLPHMPDGTPAYFDKITNTLKPRTLVEVNLSAGTELNGLKSTASDIKPWDGASGINKGGDIQIYSPQVKSSNPTIKPVQ